MPVGMLPKLRKKLFTNKDLWGPSASMCHINDERGQLLFGWRSRRAWKGGGKMLYINMKLVSTRTRYLSDLGVN